MFQRNVRIFNNNIIVGNKQKQRVTKKTRIIPSQKKCKSKRRLLHTHKHSKQYVSIQKIKQNPVFIHNKKVREIYVHGLVGGI